MKAQTTSRFQLVLSMLIFGSIGIFVKYIAMPSSVVACARGLVGTIFLLFIALITKNKISFCAIKKNFAVLFFSGAAIGFNWILLFEAYNYTSVATATLSYYFAPFFVILISPFVLKEKISLKKAICLLVALAGMVFVSGMVQNGIPRFSEIRGILSGLGAAVFYATVIILNKKLKNIAAYEKTVMQLFIAAVVILPYMFITEDVSLIKFDVKTAGMLVLVGIVHTGIAYAMYFNSIKNLKAQTVAVLSYIDPAVAILLSAFVLKENIDIYGIIGAVMILGSAFFCEMPEMKTKKTNRS